MRERRYLLLLSLAIAGVAAPVRGGEPAAAAARPRVQVSVFNLGEVGATTSSQAVIDSLAGWADAAPAEALRWHDVPPRCLPGGWVSVVICGFKRPVDDAERKADVFAFLFDPADGAVTAAAHVHYGMTFNVDTFYHEDWGSESWVDFDGGEIAWKQPPSGTVIVIH